MLVSGLLKRDKDGVEKDVGTGGAVSMMVHIWKRNNALSILSCRNLTSTRDRH